MFKGLRLTFRRVDVLRVHVHLGGVFEGRWAVFGWQMGGRWGRSPSGEVHGCGSCEATKVPQPRTTGLHPGRRR